MHEWPKTVLTSLRVVRWLARLWAGALLLLFVVLIIGEGPPPLMWQTGALALVLVGCLLAWFTNWLGGMLLVMGIVSFYAINFAKSGNFPRGWLLPSLFVAGTILLICARIDTICRYQTKKQA